jgi:hypothetical protein
MAGASLAARSAQRSRSIHDVVRAARSDAERLDLAVQAGEECEPRVGVRACGRTRRRGAEARPPTRAGGNVYVVAAFRASVGWCAMLSYRQQIARMRHLAVQALDAYPLVDPELRFVAHGENTTFRVDASAIDGRDRFLLRVHRPARHGRHATTPPRANATPPSARNWSPSSKKRSRTPTSSARQTGPGSKVSCRRRRG